MFIKWGRATYDLVFNQNTHNPNLQQLLLLTGAEMESGTFSDGEKMLNARHENYLGIYQFKHN